MINTAIEGAIDVSTTSFDPMAKLAKDVAAGAVLIATLNAVAVGYLVFSDRIGNRSSRVLEQVRDAPAQLTIGALALTVIVVIAVKAWTGRGTPLRGGLPSGHAAIAFAAWIAATYIAGEGRALPRLDDRSRDGAARRADADRVGHPLGVRGAARRPRRRPRLARDLPAGVTACGRFVTLPFQVSDSLVSGV